MEEAAQWKTACPACTTKVHPTLGLKEKESLGSHCPGWSQLLSTFKQLELWECAMMPVFKIFLEDFGVLLESGPLLSHRNKEKRGRERETDRERAIAVWKLHSGRA